MGCMKNECTHIGDTKRNVNEIAKKMTSAAIHFDKSQWKTVHWASTIYLLRAGRPWRTGWISYIHEVNVLVGGDRKELT